MSMHLKCEIGPKLRHFLTFLNFKKPGTYVKHPYMNSICTKFEGRRWKNDSVIDHASQPKIANVSPNFHVFCPNDLEDEGQGHPFSIAIESYLICISQTKFAQGQPIYQIWLTQVRRGLSYRVDKILTDRRWTDAGNDITLKAGSLFETAHKRNIIVVELCLLMTLLTWNKNVQC